MDWPYMSTEDVLPEWVVFIGYLKEFSPGPIQFSNESMNTFPKSIVGSQYLLWAQNMCFRINDHMYSRLKVITVIKNIKRGLGMKLDLELS